MLKVNIFRQLCFAFLALVLCAFTAHGQDSPTGVSVRILASGNIDPASSGYGTLSVSATTLPSDDIPNGNFYLTGSANMPNVVLALPTPDSTQSQKLNARLEPGKYYDFNITGYGLADFSFSVIPMAGYQVEIEEQIRTNYTSAIDGVLSLRVRVFQTFKRVFWPGRLSYLSFQWQD